MSHSSPNSQRDSEVNSSLSSGSRSEALIVHEAELAHYSPPGHTGTVNVRLVESSFNGAFELIHGSLAPGAEAEAHQHEREYQVFYVVSGKAKFALGTNPPATYGPGSVFRVPPLVKHYIGNAGEDQLELVIVYSPPLPPRDDRPVRV